MEKPRCGMKDPVFKFELNERHRKKRYTLQGETWDFRNNPSVSFNACGLDFCGLKEIFIFTTVQNSNVF